MPTLDLLADACLVVVIQAETFVVKSAQQSAADHTYIDAHRTQEPQDGTNTHTLLRAPRADLVHFELAFFINGEYADRLVLGQTGAFQGGGCSVGGRSDSRREMVRILWAMTDVLLCGCLAGRSSGLS